MPLTQKRLRLLEKLDTAAPLRVVLVNDLGFQYGAGIACRRTAQAFLRHGHQVALVAAHVGDRDDGTAGCPEFEMPGWLGIIHPAVLHKDVIDEALVLPIIHGRIAALKADAVIVGNIHNPCPSRRYLPPELLRLLAATETVTACYAHDLHYASGGCYYPGQCQHASGVCTAERCPQAATVPPRLAARQETFRRLFSARHRLPLVANSHWTAAMLRRAHGDIAVPVVPCAVETDVFRPDPDARAALGLPADRRLVGIGACSLQDRRKGAHLLPAIIEQTIGACPDTAFLAFGQGAQDLSLRYPGHVFAMGYLDSPQRLALAFAAMDAFLFTSGEEALGQVLIEAAACGVPVVAFDVGGVSDIARHGVNALLCPHGDLPALGRHLQQTLNDAGPALGRNGRAIAEAEFGLASHLEAWLKLLRQWAASPTPAVE